MPQSTMQSRIVRSISLLLIVTIVRVCRALRLVRWECQPLPPLPAPSERIVFVANHIEWHDIPLLVWAIPQQYRLWWFAKAELFAHWMRWWFRQLPMIPVRRGTGDTTALERAIATVAAGAPLVIFPEGTWDDGRLLRAKTGCARIACATNAWIVPIGLTGRNQPLWYGQRRVTFGSPFRLTDLPAFRPDIPCGEQPMTELTTAIMLRIAALLPDDYHGVYRSSSD